MLYEKTRRNMNFQSRAKNYENLMRFLKSTETAHRELSPLFAPGITRNNRNAINSLITKMSIYVNSKKGTTRAQTMTRSRYDIERMARNYKSILNNTATLYKTAGKSVKYTGTKYVQNHPGMAKKLQQVLNNVRRKKQMNKELTASLRRGLSNRRIYREGLNEIKRKY